MDSDCFFTDSSDRVFPSQWRDDLPFLALSCILSASVPRKRCSGFTHLRLSHLCRTNNPEGIDPLVSSHDMRCAFTGVFEFSANCPYPVCVNTDHCHSQHPLSTRLTLDQNRQAVEHCFSLPPFLRSNSLPQ